MAVVLGLPVAWVLARHRFRGRSVVRALVTLPMVLPPVVGGVGLLAVFGRRGLLGAHFGSLPGFPLPFTVQAVVLAQAFVAMPFLVLAAEGGLRQLDRSLRGRGRHPRRPPLVPVPDGHPPPRRPVAPGRGARWPGPGPWASSAPPSPSPAACPGRTRTLPTSIYAGLQSRPESAIALSVVLLAVSLTVLVALRGRWR